MSSVESNDIFCIQLSSVDGIEEYLTPTVFSIKLWLVICSFKLFLAMANVGFELSSRDSRAQ